MRGWRRNVLIDSNTKALALLAAAATGVQVGASIVASRLVVDEVQPMTLAMLRYMVGVLCLLPFALGLSHSNAQAAQVPETSALAAGEMPYRKLRDWTAICLLGIGQFGALIALLNYGLLHVHAANAALIFSLMPLLTLSLSAALGQGRASLSLAGGVALSIGGVALALSPKLAASGGTSWLGELAVLASAALGALCSVLYRPYLRRHRTVQVSFAAMLASVLALMLLALPEHWPQRVGYLSSGAWGAITFLGLLSALGYGGWLYALKHLAPTQVTVFLSLSPLTAALLAWPMLGEAPGAHVLGAVVLIGAGLWLASRGAADAATDATRIDRSTRSR